MSKFAEVRDLMRKIMSDIEELGTMGADVFDNPITDIYNTADYIQGFMNKLCVEKEVSLVFDDWRGEDGRSIYNTEKGVELSEHDFHSGTTFKATIELDQEQAAELERALEDGYTPVFWVSGRAE